MSPNREDFARRRKTIGLILLFAMIYFVQGVAEPTEGLIAQPVRSLLRSWEYSATAIASFGALLSVPWMLKPAYGLLTDFVPLAGTRRRSYLIATSGAAAAGLMLLYVIPLPVGAYSLLLILLLVPTVGVAFSDVVVDALMIEKGQPRGLTGKLQSVQWAAMYGGTLIAGLAGGWLSQRQLQKEGFLLCGIAIAATLILALLFVREEEEQQQTAAPRHRFRAAIKELIDAARTPAVATAAAFLFLWSFNPFSTSVLYLYMTGHLGISEQTYGFTVSMLSVGAIAGSLAYGAYCRRVSTRTLIHVSIAAGVLSTLAYMAMQGPTSAALISVLVGFAYLTGSMVQFDLAAQACPIHVAGTTFALLMSVSNLSLSLSAAVGGWIFDRWSAQWGEPVAFRWLVLLGAGTTCLCWLLVPLILRTIKPITITDLDPP
jgi:MFS family permease